jgi:hypothetical protein
MPYMKRVPGNSEGRLSVHLTTSYLYIVLIVQIRENQNAAGLPEDFRSSAVQPARGFRTPQPAFLYFVSSRPVQIASKFILVVHSFCTIYIACLFLIVF